MEQPSAVDLSVADTTIVEAQLRAALDNMPGAVVYTDEDLDIVVVQRALQGGVRGAARAAAPRRAVPELSAPPRRPRLLRQRRCGRPRWRSASRACANPTGGASRTTLPDGRWYRILRHRVAGGGTVTVMTDITELKLAEQVLADREGQLQVALDNMPGALVYTDNDLNIVVCNDRFKDMYTVPPELLQPGQPYTAFLSYLARTATTARATPTTLVAQRVESLRHPTGKSFEDHAPDGRCFRILRRPVAAGGTVTVMTDITEQKQAERELIDATRRTEEANRQITEKNRTLEAL